MPLLTIGINHNTASVDLREKVAFSPDKLNDAFQQLHSMPTVKGSVILSTCNRTELYVDTENSNDIVDWLIGFHQVKADDLKPSLYTYTGEEAIQHLMRVACGLDSLVLGEPQILGQVKKAYADAKENATVHGNLDKLFQKAFSVAKRVRTETDIGGSAVSVAYAACTLAKHIFESLDRSKVLLVGAGETIELVAKHLSDNGCRQMTVANRTRERASSLANQFDAQVISLSEIPLALANADIVISSTASPLPIIGKGMVESALKSRRYKPILFIDIAVPRDIEAQVSELSDAYLYTVDDLQSIIDQNIEQRRSEAVQAEKIIAIESKEFKSWLRSRKAVESIRDYRHASDVARRELLAKSLQTLSSGGDPEKVLLELSNKLTNKLIHAPTKALQEAAEQGELDDLAVLRKGLGLEDL
ncbi:glutamyl-tRNA reductase [Vibrio sp. UCD-FRSSP16_10]|uniref:glutamyl-tRNA reductase n=1 Tax=unclassified Vibrio TaxID=2614977 RepID=UPI0007FC98A7|nr:MULTISPECIES: glutamyl-tRNA reductase [unclassified Vibrio]OBT15998.1 glutamyl-tRNA reductase [Vibrio sp. UCD-FRSSP16_30]OBT21081.1 glutamyl-tRNA reductase [Vibrio sp. UCD-FRSSP16_10]